MAYTMHPDDRRELKRSMTRDNVEGMKKLAWNLKHKTPRQLALEKKRRDEAQADRRFSLAKSAIAVEFAGQYLHAARVRFTVGGGYRHLPKWLWWQKMVAWFSLVPCRLGHHDWTNGYKLVVKGERTDCRRPGCVALRPDEE